MTGYRLVMTLEIKIRLVRGTMIDTRLDLGESHLGPVPPWNRTSVCDLKENVFCCREKNSLEIHSQETLELRVTRL